MKSTAIILFSALIFNFSVYGGEDCSYQNIRNEQTRNMNLINHRVTALGEISNIKTTLDSISNNKESDSLEDICEKAHDISSSTKYILKSISGMEGYLQKDLDDAVFYPEERLEKITSSYIRFKELNKLCLTKGISKEELVEEYSEAYLYFKKLESEFSSTSDYFLKYYYKLIHWRKEQVEICDKKLNGLRNYSSRRCLGSFPKVETGRSPALNGSYKSSISK